MSVLHPALLFGLALAAIPIVLHLLMRARPRKLDFPALRLLNNIRKQSVQRMRLRHLGLLLLRILVLVLIVLAVARPTLPAANYALTSSELFRLIGVGVLCAGAWWAGRRYWVSEAKQKHAQRYRETWLNAGTIAAILLLALLLVGWPYQRRVAAELTSPEGPRQLNVPVAGVLLFDLSASMSYQHENQNRLEVARRLALQQIEALPGGSKVTLADNGELRPLKFLNEIRAAETRLQKANGLTLRDRALSLNDVVLSAIQLQAEDRAQILEENSATDASDRYVREIYIYTDRFSSAWNLDEAERLKAEMERLPWLRLYIIDVGVEGGTNYGLSNVSLSRERVVEGSLVRVSAEIINQSRTAENCLIELYLDDGTGSLIKRDQKIVEVEPDQVGQITMSFPAQGRGVFQGELRLAKSDPLSVDNAVAFSAFVEPREVIWIVSDRPDEAFVWQQALAPRPLVERNAHQYEVSVLPSSQLNRSLEQTNGPRPGVIYLLNVARLSEGTWERLEQFARTGGGLGVILGSTRVDQVNYQDYAQPRWLPGQLKVHSRATPSARLEVSRPDHPVFRYLDQLNALALFTSAEVHRYWKIEPAVESSVLARFTDDERTPAVIARGVGRGQSMIISTAVDLADAAQLKNWSELARMGWIYAAWADQTTRFLAGDLESPLNRTVGAPVFLDIPPETAQQKALLRMPGLRQEQIAVPLRSKGLVISTSQPEEQGGSTAETNQNLVGMVGNYRLLFPGTDIPGYGFSLQLPDQETSLSRLSVSELDELFGEGRWQLSRSFSELERSVLLGRIGIEAYPMLMTLLLVFFISEHLVANLFYRMDRA
ncbi:BatA domain-containing protein [Rubinisphaera margarita]|uniref:BatA domain-containing protein n=1 Tax=Rubinisphaera margarita TaxID=2909586 RepID=UPI001EE7D161|nr:BatA domain-containing protein [Rubinisphaera margarita]MCG6156116.1 BatA domain-containing protein [Rubinisphaera margarita]